MIKSHLSGKRLWVVAVLATAFFILSIFCYYNKDVSRSLSYSQAPVFTYLNSVFLASIDVPLLFQFSDTIINRTLSRYNNGYLLWDSLERKLIYLNDKGDSVHSIKLEAAFVWVSNGVLLAREDVFTKGHGFQFVFYKFVNNSLHEVWRGELDCFPSDVLFCKDDVVYLAGGNQENSTNSVYMIRSGFEVLEILSLPKQSDFLRLIKTSESLFVFASSRDKSIADMSLFVMDYADSSELSGFKKITPFGIPANQTSFFGFGFSFNNEPVIPIADLNGDISLVRFERVNSCYKVVSVIENSGGCFLPLGMDDSTNSFWYLAHDSLTNQLLFNLGRYDGDTITLIKFQ